MDTNRKAILGMLIRRVSDGDRCQYMDHFAEARDITVGEYQEYMDSITPQDMMRHIFASIAGVPSSMFGDLNNTKNNAENMRTISEQFAEDLRTIRGQ